jgi:hypothetical protein
MRLLCCLFFISAAACGDQQATPPDAGVTQVCKWNADTGKYDRDCTFSGGRRGLEPDGGSCGDGAVQTAYFSNDPRCQLDW